MALVLLVAAIVATDGANPFYTQLRVGRGGKTFRMLKLRSMVRNADQVFEAHLAANPEARREWEVNQKLAKDPRVTRIGRVIRKTSIDELPQLLNVLLGQMSIVGPRPFMIEQKPLYPGRAYYEMRPGMTGNWQVSDRSIGAFASRADFDEAYYRNLSFREDCRIISQTIGVLMRATGV